MNIVKPAIYTEQMTALNAGLNKLQWSMRDRKPNAEVIEMANGLQREMVKLSQYIVTEYRGR